MSYEAFYEGLTAIGRSQICAFPSFPMGVDWATPPDLGAAGVVRTWELQVFPDLSGVFNAEWDLTLDGFPSNIEGVEEICRAMAVLALGRGALSVFFAFEGSAELSEELAPNIYGVANPSMPLRLALDDELRDSAEWYQVVARARRELEILADGRDTSD